MHVCDSHVNSHTHTKLHKPCKITCNNRAESTVYGRHTVVVFSYSVILCIYYSVLFNILNISIFYIYLSHIVIKKQHSILMYTVNNIQDI